MRIISGKLGGRPLKTVRDAGLRPAMGKTREALFSMLEARGIAWDGLHVLDLFAGSGSLAFECLSRGAASAVLVENSKNSLECISGNISSLNLDAQCSVRGMDVLKFLRMPAPYPFDLVFLDPPYRRNLANPVLAAIERAGWLPNGAFIVAELEKDAPLAESPCLERQVRRLFGQTCLHIWKKI